MVQTKKTKKQHLIHVITECYDLPGENSPEKNYCH